MNRNRILRALLVALLACAVAQTLQAAPRPDAALVPELTRKIDARLLSHTLGSPGEVVSAWVHFVDKGERGPADLSSRLAQAERALSPRNRARRLKAGVTPLVDERDLPVDAEYLDALRADGLHPFAVSRWFNRAAVRVPAGELPRIARFGFVSRLAPVERMWRMRDPEPEAAGLASPIGPL